MLTRLLLAIALLLPHGLHAQAIAFPPAPEGQVVDSGRWLDRDRREYLESELGRYRAHYHLDLMVVLWDRGLPSETSLEELADRLGQTWSREETWIVVLHIPDSMHRPAVVAGGPGLNAMRDEAIVDALHRGVTRGMKERTTRAQVEALALETGEEFIFLKNRRLLEHKAILAAQNQEAHDRQARHQAMILRAAVVTLLALVSVGALALLYFFKRRPAKMEFPETRWRRRLGAPWCGGGHVVVSLPGSPPTS